MRDRLRQLGSHLLRNEFTCQKQSNKYRRLTLEANRELAGWKLRRAKKYRLPIGLCSASLFSAQYNTLTRVASQVQIATSLSLCWRSIIEPTEVLVISVCFRALIIRLRHSSLAWAANFFFFQVGENFWSFKLAPEVLIANNFLPESSLPGQHSFP